MKTLKTLLKEVDSLWDYDIEVAYSYNYMLGRFPAGWQFTVTNDWYKWSDAKLKHTFGVYSEPEYAIMGFLDYVRNNNVDVKSLANRMSIEEYEKLIKSINE